MCYVQLVEIRILHSQNSFEFFFDVQFICGFPFKSISHSNFNSLQFKYLTLSIFSLQNY